MVFFMQPPGAGDVRGKPASPIARNSTVDSACFLSTHINKRSRSTAPQGRRHQNIATTFMPRSCAHHDDLCMCVVTARCARVVRVQRARVVTRLLASRALVSKAAVADTRIAAMPRPRGLSEYRRRRSVLGAACCLPAHTCSRRRHRSSQASMMLHMRRARSYMLRARV